MDDPCGKIDVPDYQHKKNPVEKHIWYQDQIYRKNNGKQNSCKICRTDYNSILLYMVTLLVDGDMVALLVDGEGV